ncbi:MAG TPA: CopD family protein, partial [Chloroflexia bacterium]|nr:CopD family protein [Chloroflexia bacterium]
TRYGFAWTMKVLSALALIALFLLARTRGKGGSGLWESGIAAGSLFLLAESLSSHAAAVQGESVAGLPLPVISDWVHLVTASTWVGGLLFFVAVLFPGYRRAGLTREERVTFLAAVVPRFSKLALVSVLALGVSGTYNLAIQTTDLGAIWASLYGQVVALKVVLFLALIGIGAINLAYVSPRLGLASSPGGEGTISSFRRNVRLEVGLVMLVLLCAGGLTLLPPPSDASPQATSQAGGLSLPTPTSLAATPTGAAPRGPATASTAVAGRSVLLSVERVEAGEVFSVTLQTGVVSGELLTDVTRLVLTVSPQGLDAGSTVLATELQGEAVGGTQLWVGRGAVLPFAGRYLVTAVAQRSANADLKSAFLMTLGESGDLSVEAISYVEARIRTEREPPVPGSNNVIVALRGAEGEPISGAEVHISATGPESLLSGPRLRLEPVPGAPGDYTARLEFPVQGAWSLEVSVSRQGQPELRLRASVDVAEAP